jgi:hypothetical protein
VAGWWFSDERPDPVRELAARNSLFLIDLLQQLIEEFIAEEDVGCCVGPEIIREMHRIAMRGLIPSAGVFRDGPATIDNSMHVPPPHTEVPGLVDEMCTVLATNWHGEPIWLAAYAMWRLNWIHPFADGNGRTARALSYLVLCVSLGLPRFPGGRALTARIADEKLKYWHCLVEADRFYKRRHRVNVSHMQGFLEKHVRGLLREALDKPPPK